MSKICIVSDAWHPQINGVVTTLQNIKIQCEKRGHDVHIFSPNDCPVKMPLPGYSEITLGFIRVCEEKLYNIYVRGQVSRTYAWAPVNDT